MQLKALTKTATNSINKNSPTILLVMGVGGLITASIFASRATLKANKAIEQKKNEKMPAVNPPKSTDEIKLDKREVVKTVWKYYIPTAIITSTSVACIVGSSKITSKRTAALAAAYKISETALAEYQNKLVEVVGEKKAQAVKERIAADDIKKDPPKQNQIIFSGKGDSLFKDSVSKRYFKSNVDTIQKAVNKLNSLLYNEMFVSLNDFYDLIGLEDVAIGDDLGWNVEDGLIEIDYVYIGDDDGNPCAMLNYFVVPRWDYKNVR